MPYSDFDLRKIRNELGLKITEREKLFAAIEAVEISPALQEILSENLPLARAINTEIAPCPNCHREAHCGGFKL